VNYKKVGRSGLKISVIGLGALTFGDQVNESDAEKIIKSAIDAGINYIDTADAYVQGRSEEIVGKALKERRKSIVLGSKLGRWQSGEDINDVGLSRKYIMQEVENSLRRLGTDYIDIYHAHRVDYDTPIEETLRAFDDLIHQGKVRYIACSNFRAFQLCEALWVSDKYNLARFECIQIPYNLITRDIEYELLPCCESEGVGVTVFNPLAAGLLSGKHDLNKAPASGTRFSLNKNYYEDKFMFIHVVFSPSI